jgi:hypothetical protein
MSGEIERKSLLPFVRVGRTAELSSFCSFEKGGRGVSKEIRVILIKFCILGGARALAGPLAPRLS